MDQKSKQSLTWKSDFGKEYTDRNPLTIEAMDKVYMLRFGKTRSEFNRQFLGNLDRSIRILEVGANVGSQLQGLQGMGFENLYGIELQSYAIERAKENSRNMNFIQGSAFDIPHKEGSFDLVFTSGVLIHFSPRDLIIAMDEIHRSSKRYIWGFEYWAENHTEIDYRGHKGLLWKGNFSQMYVDRFSDLRLIKEEHYRYSQSENVDSMFLLEIVG